MRVNKENIIVQKTIHFALKCIKYSEVLEHKKKYVIANQFLRSSTSIGANVCEAQNAESKADFIHKMKIASKEASETLYWLTLCEQSEGYEADESIRQNLDEIMRILSKIIATANE